MLKIALISCHASPLAVVASGDCESLGLYVAQLACELGALGCQVDIFTRRYRIEQPQVHYWQPNVRVIHVPVGPPGIAGRERLRPTMEQFGRFMVGFARRQRGGYDIAHACDLASGCAAQQLRRTLGIPYIVTLHAPPHGAEASATVQQQLVTDADRVLVLCRQQREALLAMAGAQRARIDIVPCGFDSSLLWPVRLRARSLLRLPAEALVVLHVGHLAPGHGVDLAIEGVALLASQHRVKTQTQLVVIGAAVPEACQRLQHPKYAEPPELARLRELAQRLDVAVTFAGPQTSAALRHWYSAADVCLAMPRHSAFGMAVLGAMACATPVIGAAVGCIGDAVVDGETGYLVAPGDPAALAARLARLHDNPVQARSFGVQGWRHAHRHYTWRAVALRLTAVYAQVLTGVADEVVSGIVAAGVAGVAGVGGAANEVANGVENKVTNKVTNKVANAVAVGVSTGMTAGFAVGVAAGVAVGGAVAVANTVAASALTA